MSVTMREQVALFLSEAKEHRDVPGGGWSQDDVPPTLRCGCTASAVRLPDGQPSCPIHQCDEVVDRPNLTDRVAVCACCRKMALSAFGLPFFKYRGPGSMDAAERCVRCGFLVNAHTPKAMSQNPRLTCTEFTPDPEGAEADEYYCGCRGWD